MTLTRRHILKLAGLSSAAAALAGAVKAEGQASLSTAADALPFALTTPMHVGEAALKVRDLDSMTAYYRSVLGLAELTRTDKQVTLGTGKVALLHLVHAPNAEFESQTSAGLFHIAYLMPNRKDLARWLVHVAMMRVPLTGFADHSVSEAIYLNDPEGNGIEVYHDRPKSEWKWDGDVVTMGTHQLDVDGIVALTDTTKDDYTAAPGALRIGHMHLRVGDITGGRAFYETAIGLQSTRGNREDAAFLSSGRYHHHVAMNIWNSKGAGKRQSTETGLDWFSLTVADTAKLAEHEDRLRKAGHAVTKSGDNILETVDPWGTRLRLVTA